MTNYPEITFQRGAVEPVECLKAGWELIKDQYWLFVGLCAVGMIIGSAVPLGNLNGTMMCGMFLTFFRKRKGLPIEFGTMFKGFDYFGQSVVAALLHVIPIMGVIIAAYIVSLHGMFAAMFATAAAEKMRTNCRDRILSYLHSLLHRDSADRYSDLNRIYVRLFRWIRRPELAGL
jgi:hypothetical protein